MLRSFWIIVAVWQQFIYGRLLGEVKDLNYLITVRYIFPNLYLFSADTCSKFITIAHLMLKFRVLMKFWFEISRKNLSLHQKKKKKKPSQYTETNYHQSCYFSIRPFIRIFFRALKIKKILLITHFVHIPPRKRSLPAFIRTNHKCIKFYWKLELRI